MALVATVVRSWSCARGGLPASFEAGASIAGYRVERLLGRGGMGAVYLAVDTRLERPVALKVLPAELANDAGFRQRFLSESQLAASLDHPNIVPIYEAGEAEGRLYIAMRYVEGADLEAIVRRDGPLDATRALRILHGVADALDAAHDRGLIHRDVKPGNILVATGSRGGEHAYLSDFGLTKRQGSGDGLTRTGQIIGSVGYIAPEQIEGRPIDSRADVYSFACVLFQVLAARPPFERDTEMATMWAHVQSPPPAISTIRPDLAALDPVLERGMAKDPDARFPTAGALIAAAEAALRSGTTRGFLFSDLRGYTRFVEARGDAAAARLLDRYRGLVRTVVAAHGGAEVKTEGDSFYVVFGSASRAVQAGLTIVDEARSSTATDPSLPIEVGVGVHAGETVETDEGYVGSAVNIAARICAQAQAGEVLVSETVRSLTRTSLPVTFVPRGRPTLKGIAEPIALFAVQRTSAIGAAVQVGSSAGSLPSLTAVLARRRNQGVAVVAALAVVSLVAGAVVGGFGRPAGVSPSPPTPSSVAAVPSASPPLTGRIVFSRGPSRSQKELADSEGGLCTYLAIAGGSNLWVTGEDGAGEARLTDEIMGAGIWPALSPDGSTVAFAPNNFGDGRLRMVSIGGGAIRSSSPAVPSPLGPPSWSPDSRRITYMGTTPVGDSTYPAAFVADADGSSGKLVWAPHLPTTGSRSDPADPGIVLVDTKPDPGQSQPPEPTQSLVQVEWMASGAIALLIDPLVTEGAPAAVEAPRRIYSIQPDGTGFAPLTPAIALAMSSFTVSPDGQRVAFTYLPPAPYGVGSKPDIYVMNIDGTDIVRLTTDPGADDEPAWSPDSTQLAFSSERDGYPEIYTINVDGTNLRRVTHTQNGRVSCDPTWARSSVPIATPAPAHAGDAADPFHLELGAVPAGTYTTAPFDPSFELTLPNGWETLEVTTDGFAMWRAPDRRVQIGVSQVQVVYDGHCIDSPTRIIGPTPLDFVSWLQSNGDLKVGTVYPLSAGGATGVRVQVSVRKLSTSKCPILQSKTALYPVTNDQFAMKLDEVADFLVLDVKGKRLVFFVGGPEKDLGPLQDETQAILDSIRFP